MIEVKVQDDSFLIKGSFSLGIAGHYVNEDFSDEPIAILDTYEEVVEDYLEDKYAWGILDEYLKDKEVNEENVCEAISQYYNKLEKKVQECITQINSNLLINVFSGMVNCDYEFWNVEGAYIEEKMPEGSSDDYLEKIYSPYYDELADLFNEYEDTPNDNSIVKTDVEKRLREMFPMFNFDALIKGIQPEYLTFNGNKFSFECTDSFDASFLCAACDSLDEKFTFTDWHNF